MECPKSNDEAGLRITFVEMLFALAVGQIGIRTAELVSIDAGNKLPSLGHLALSLLLISASWFGWRQSAVRSMHQEVERLFSMQFIGFLLDALLVIVYFIVVQSVDIGNKDGAAYLLAPSAKPEALWISVVFGIYTAWDLVTDVPLRKTISDAMAEKRQSKRRTNARLYLRRAFTCAICSIICLSMSLLCYFISSRTMNVTQVLSLDLSLASTVMLFRIFKAQLETKVATWLRVTNDFPFNKTRSVGASDRPAMYVCFFMYLTAVAIST